MYRIFCTIDRKSKTGRYFRHESVHRSVFLKKESIPCSCVLLRIMVHSFMKWLTNGHDDSVSEQNKNDSAWRTTM